MIRFEDDSSISAAIAGHWEGDLIKGAGNRSAVGTLINRSTLFVMLVKMEDSTAEAALKAYSAAFAPLVRSC
nr:hypothetical protein [Paraburkholderia sp. BCC1886]